MEKENIKEVSFEYIQENIKTIGELKKLSNEVLGE